MTDERLTRKEFLALPVEERRKLLEKQANDPDVIAYYENLNKEADKARQYPDRETIAIYKLCSDYGMTEDAIRLCMEQNKIREKHIDDAYNFADGLLSLLDPEAIRREVAEEIFGEIEKHRRSGGVVIHGDPRWYQDLKSRLGGGE